MFPKKGSGDLPPLPPLVTCLQNMVLIIINFTYSYYETLHSGHLSLANVFNVALFPTFFILFFKIISPMIKIKSLQRRIYFKSFFEDHGIPTNIMNIDINERLWTGRFGASGTSLRFLRRKRFLYSGLTIKL